MTWVRTTKPSRASPSHFPVLPTSVVKSLTSWMELSTVVLVLMKPHSSANWSTTSVGCVRKSFVFSLIP